MSDLSYGQQLFHDKNLKQASCFFCDSLDEAGRQEWLDSLPKKDLRSKLQKIKEGTLCLVISQNCDIACRDDKLDDSVEIALCQKIRAKDVHEGNTFVRSVRKFHFEFNGNFYEANVDYIVTIKKEHLLRIIDDNHIEIEKLNKEYCQALPFWRANRYFRSALPDAFNSKINNLIKDYIPKLVEVAKVNKEEYEFSNFIKSFYVNLDTLEESDYYEFELFFLIRDETPDDISIEIQDIVEDFATALAESSGFSDVSEIYVDKETNTSVGYLSQFIRFNVDSYSLEQGDSDFTNANQ